jgi:phosphatidate cytidylyltransferase
MSTRERLFGFSHAFDHPLVAWAVTVIAVMFAVSWITARALRWTGLMSPGAWADFNTRWRSWVWLTLFVLPPILLGAAWVIAGVMLLSFLCYREFARATGVFREMSISAIVVLGIISLAYANFDHYDRMFFSIAPLAMGGLAIMTIPHDEPRGYIQRVALGVMGFLMFGFSLGYLGMIANDERFREILLFVLIVLWLNDVFAYCVGRALGGRKAFPNTSPGKTVSGCIGALALTTTLAATLGHLVFQGTAIDRWDRLLLFGMMMSALGQMGDLTLSSIKRDLGIKDLGHILPGHGGFLDRFDSFVVALPPIFHYLSFQLGPLGSDQAARIITGD